ncbi:homeodomain superfamily [Oleoguttula sp. CCFEE 5521]
MADVEMYKDHQNRHSLYSHRRNDSRASTPCMPTPETSQSSDTSVDEHFARPLASRGASIRALLSDEACESTVTCDRSDDHLSARMVTRPEESARYAPYSPPYRSISELRPSLPPIKTILAAPLSSPPTTPRLYDAPFPLAAREPSYVTMTFKPPAFYPNKKPRTALSPRRSPNSTPRGISLSSDRSAAARVDCLIRYSRPSISMDTEYFKAPNVWPETGQPSAQARLDHWATRYDSRRGEILQYERPGSPQSRRQSTISELRRRSIDVRSPGHFYGRERVHDHSSYNRDETGYFPNNRIGATPYFLDQDRERYAAESTQHLPTRSVLPGREHDSHMGLAGRAADIVAPDQRAAFFMPSHYEYQQGKTRKRSNLPKQSTEIMKHWFDQNIANPYPSEEQKQVFANATGISMTQVSNWFINHRRRCPELRDKRDRSRAAGGDLSD